MEKTLYVFIDNEGFSHFAYLSKEQVKVIDLIREIYNFSCVLCAINEIDTIAGFNKED